MTRPLSWQLDPFTLLPGDTARIALAILFALPSKGGEADGTTEDMQGLVELDAFVQDFYDGGMEVIDPTSVRNLTNYATSFEVSDIYPNPAAEEITLNVHLPTPGFASVHIMNILGEQVASIHEDILASGINQITYDVSQLPTGRYYCQLQWNGQVVSKPLNIIR